LLSIFKACFNYIAKLLIGCIVVNVSHPDMAKFQIEHLDAECVRRIAVFSEKGDNKSIPVPEQFVYFLPSCSQDC
jgi:hypothetical protein